MQNNNNAGVIVVVVVIAAIAAGFWYHDSQKPKNKIQANWTATEDGARLNMSFKDGALTLSVNTPEGRVTAFGRYHFISNDTMTIEFHSASISDGVNSVSVSTGALPFHAGRLTVKEVSSKSLVLSDESGQTIYLSRF